MADSTHDGPVPSPYQLLLGRRSIRDFTGEPVPDTTVEKILRAAMCAPSAGNAQDWQFVVVRDRTIMEGVTRFHPYAKMLSSAPVSILVCGDTNREKYPGFWVQDCSAATQNILLAAHFLGLGAVWLGFYPIPERVQGAIDLFRLPKGVIPMTFVPIGHPGEKKSLENRFQADRVHKNVWGGTDW